MMPLKCRLGTTSWPTVCFDFNVVGTLGHMALECSGYTGTGLNVLTLCFGITTYSLKFEMLELTWNEFMLIVRVG